MRFSFLALAAILALTGCGTTAAPGFAAARGEAFAAAAARDPVAAVHAANALFKRRDPALVEAKYAKMAESAFSFFRGTSYLYYADVRQEPSLATALRLPLQGDLHLENLGTYRTSSGEVAFDLNDFDEAFEGPYAWELARLAVSVHLAAGGEAQGLVDHFLARYRHHLAAAGAADLARPLTADRLSGPAAEAIAEARQVSRADFLAKLTKKGRFKLGKKLQAIPEARARELAAAVARYAEARRAPAGFFAVKDAAARLAGTASIGRYRYLARIEGPSPSADDDVILEVKEEAAPAAGPAGGNQADRVRKAYAYFLPEPDPFLGTLRMGQDDYLVREYSPAKNDVAIDDLDPKALAAYVDTVALAAARAHARSGRAVAIAADLQARGPAIAAFAGRYAAQVRNDHAAFKRAI